MVVLRAAGLWATAASLIASLAAAPVEPVGGRYSEMLAAAMAGERLWNRGSPGPVQQTRPAAPNDGHLSPAAKNTVEVAKERPLSQKTQAASCLLNKVTPMDFGAVGDGVADDTDAVLKAFQYSEQCTVDLAIGPAGREFLVTPEALKVTLRNVTLTFDGWLAGPSLSAWNPQQEPFPKGSCAFGEVNCQRADGSSPEMARSMWNLLHLVDSSNVTLAGSGGIKGVGASFWTVRNARPAVRGYCLLKLEGCHGVFISGIKLMQAPMYQVTIANSAFVRVHGVQTSISDHRLGEDGPHNTDGVSIIRSSNIDITDSVVESGDDNIVIKEGSHNIYCKNLSLVRGKGIAIGSLGERGSKDQVVTDVVFRNVTMTQSAHGARIKTWKGGEGLIRNVTFSDFHLNDVFVGVLIDQGYCPVSQRPEGCWGGPEQAISIEDVHFANFEGTYTATHRQVACTRCMNVTLDLRMRPREAMPASLMHWVPTVHSWTPHAKKLVTRPSAQARLAAPRRAAPRLDLRGASGATKLPSSPLGSSRWWCAISFLCH